MKDGCRRGVKERDSGKREFGWGDARGDELREDAEGGERQDGNREVGSRKIDGEGSGAETSHWAGCSIVVIVEAREIEV